MAAKKTSKSSRPVKTERSLKDRVADVALKTASQQGWGELTLSDLADSVKEPFGLVVEVFPTTDRIAAYLFSRVDSIVLAAIPKIDHDESPRDRLFEVLMMRFDALQAERAGYAAILRSMQRRPFSMFMRIPGLIHSMALILIVSGIDATGPFGVARAHALGAIYIMALRTWLKDDSSDMAQTMSALDKGLDRLEQLQKMFMKPSIKAGSS
ncbi:MAG: TetR family transcriptional regulator [Rhodospirillaceae bacterium]